MMIKNTLSALNEKSMIYKASDFIKKYKFINNTKNKIFRIYFYKKFMRIF